MRSMQLASFCFLVLGIFMITSCGSKEPDPKMDFEGIINRLDSFLGKQPLLLLVDRTVIVDGTKTPAYHVDKIVGYEMAYDIQKTDELASPYLGYDFILIIELTYQRVSNQDSRSGFYSAADALSYTEPKDFGKEYESTATIHYAYQEGKWVYKRIEGSAMPGWVVNCLRELPQNQEWRDAIGIVR